MTSNIFELDDNKLVEKFVQGSNQLLASANLRLEVNGGTSQLIARNGDLMAIMYLQNKPRTAIVKHSSQFLESINRLLIDRDFVMFGDATRAGFIEYKHFVTPAGYRVWYTDPSVLWKKWWPTEKFQNKQRFNMDVLVGFKDNWYPVQNINVSAGTFTIKTIAGQLIVKRDGKVLWLAQVMLDHTATPEIDRAAETPTTIEEPDLTEYDIPSSSIDLVRKIQQKQLEINPDRALIVIKELEQKLQFQIKLNAETEEKFNQLISRATIAEQRLQVVYKYLHSIGVSPHDIYQHK